MNKRGKESYTNQTLPGSVSVRAVGSTVIAGAGGVGNNQNYQYSTRPVTVRVLGTNVETESTPLVNFNVKIFNPENKKEQRVFVLRNVSEPSMSTPESLMNQFCTQFGWKKQPYHFGYMTGSLRVSIRTSADMKDVWLQVSRGENVVLWCESAEDKGSDSEDEPPKKRRKKPKKLSALEEKNERIEDVIKNLRKKHNDLYTSIQYRLWAEMIDIGTHRSMDDPPHIPAFAPPHKKRGTSEISQLTSALTQIAGAMTPASQPSSSTAVIASATGISPAKMASLRSNYLQQMRDLHMLLENGAISDTEFAKQKKPILEQLKKLVPD